MIRVGHGAFDPLAHHRRTERQGDLSETARGRDPLLHVVLAAVDLGAAPGDEHVDELRRGLLQEQADADGRVQKQLQRAFDPIGVLGHGGAVDSRSSAIVATSVPVIFESIGAGSSSGPESREVFRRARAMASADATAIATATMLACVTHSP